MKDHELLNKLSSITAFGDSITLLTMMVIIERSGFGILNAAYGTVIKGVGIFAGAILSVFVINKFRSGTIFLSTQLISALFSLVVILNVSSKNISLTLLYTSIFVITALQQVFNNTREAYSKKISEEDNHPHFQSQSSFFKGMFGAQTVGPMIAFILIKATGIIFPLSVDLITFIVAAAISFYLKRNIHLHSPENFKSSIEYILRDSSRQTILVLRSIGFWIGIGLINYLQFPLIESNYHLSVIDMAWVFSIQGLGGYIGNEAIKKIRKERDTKEWVICLVGHFLLVLGGFLFLILNDFKFALFAMLFSSIGAGINMVASQSLRKQIISQKFFAQFVSIELILGRSSFWLISSVAKVSIESGVNYKIWYFVGLTFVFFVGLVHLRFKDMKVVVR